MYKALIIFFFLTGSLFADDLSHLDEIEKGKAVVGNAVKAKDLKGKIIIFKYWGHN